MIHVIILAAGTIRKKINFLKDTFDSPALIPVGTKPLASKVIDFYLKSLPEFKIHIAINEEIISTVKKFLFEYEQRINIIPISHNKGVNDTLRSAISAISLSDEIIVNLVTTIPTYMVDTSEVLLEEKISSSDEWSSIDLNDSKVVFNYKNSNNVTYGHAFTGIFRTRVGLLTEVLDQLHDDEFKDLLHAVEYIHKQKKNTFKKIEWIDCGHEMNYYKAKTKLTSSRSFNQIEIHPVKSTLRKKSLHHKTQKEEIDFILNLPSDLRIYFPRILKKPRRNGTFTEVEMEYYGYPSLAEYMLFWDMNNGLWQNVFNALVKVMGEFQTYKSDINIENYIKFYWGKTENRLIDFKSQLGANNSIFEDELTINGIQYKNFQYYKEQILDKLSDLYHKSKFNIMHGDLCFNNILYDLNSGTIRLIDPRGSFGDTIPGIYGDQCYDIAKISHSVLGRYDYFVNGLFSFTENHGDYRYEIFERRSHKSIVEINEKLIEHFGYNVNDITFLMSLLFISMTALHYDSENRQKVFYLHGINLLSESLEI